MQDCTHAGICTRNKYVSGTGHPPPPPAPTIALSYAYIGQLVERLPVSQLVLYLLGQDVERPLSVSVCA
jgi:hypothetical protein